MHESFWKNLSVVGGAGVIFHQSIYMGFPEWCDLGISMNHYMSSTPLRMRQGPPPSWVVSAGFLGLLEHQWTVGLEVGEDRVAFEHFSLGSFQSSC